MTMANTTNRNEWNSAADQTAFSYTFRIDRKEDLRVFVAGAETTAFTVDTLGNESGGTATLVTPASAGDLVVLLRNTVETQNTQYPERGPFPTAATEFTLDKLTQIVQDHTEQLTRAPAFVPGGPTSGVAFPEPVPGGLIQWDGAGQKLVAGESTINTFEGNPAVVVAEGPIAVGTTEEDVALGLAGTYQIVVSTSWQCAGYGFVKNADPSTGFSIVYGSPAAGASPTRTISLLGAP